MNFSDQNIGLPQFSELTSRSNSIQITSGYEVSAAQLHGGQSTVFTTASTSDETKQSIVVSV